MSKTAFTIKVKTRIALIKETRKEWAFCPAPRSIPSKKVYDRKKFNKNWD